MTKALSQLAETRAECIFRHVKRLTRETRASLEDYSEDVLRVWQERTPPAARGADFRETGSIFERMQSNGQKIRRWMNPEVSARPSVDVEEALVLALPEPFRGDCLRELAARYGGMFVGLPDEAAPGLAHAGELVRECGEALTALAPLFADGVIDERDDPEALRRARRELLDVQARVRELVVRVEHALERAEEARAKAPVELVRSRA